MHKADEKKEIVLGISASIACYKSCEIVSGLVQRGISVHTVLTRAATNLISPLLFQYLSGNRSYSDLFSSGNFSPEHISLADRADLVIIAPATANTIAKLACGTTDNLLSCLVYAATAPVLIAPAMNTRMYRHPVTQENIKKIKALGYRLIGPEKGWLSCGAEGEGRMSTPQDIITAAIDLLKEERPSS